MGSSFHSLRWPLTVIAIGILALVAYRWTLQSAGEVADSAGRTVERVGRGIVEFGARFQSGTITQTFLSSIPEVSGTGLGNLELATAEVTEVITATDERKILWDSFSLGETTSEIRVPVTYRYHLRLADPWRVDVEGQSVIVHAPELRPSLPPAIDTKRMTRSTDQDLLRFNGADQLAALERELTPTLSRFAGDERHLALVREESRRTVAEFVRAWLLSEDHWSDERFRSIVVLFPGEAPAERPFGRPTLELEH